MSEWTFGPKQVAYCVTCTRSPQVTPKTPKSVGMHALRLRPFSLMRTRPHGPVRFLPLTTVRTAHSGLYLEFGAPLFRSIFTALLRGLDDYTIDERGDVGSWIRIACIRGLGALSGAVFKDTNIMWLEEDVWHEVVGSVLKQGAERLDNVRGEAGAVIVEWVGRPEGTRWSMDGRELMKEAFAM